LKNWDKEVNSENIKNTYWHRAQRLKGRVPPDFLTVVPGEKKESKFPPGKRRKGNVEDDVGKGDGGF